LKRQLSQFLQDQCRAELASGCRKAERQKEQLEREISSRERQLEASAARKVKAGAKERDEALKAGWMKLRRIALLERLFIDARGRTGGDNRGNFLRSFAPRLRLSSGSAKTPMGRDILEPIGQQGQHDLGD